MWPPVLCWSIVVLEVVAWAVMRQGDAMVVPTLLAYGARWVWLIPVAVVAPLSLWRRSVVVPVAVALAVGLVGVMQFQWPHLAPRETCCRLTIVTLNGNQKARPGAFSHLVEDSGADIVAMQEWEQPTAGPVPTGWRVHCEGELCVAARHPIQKIDVMYSGRGEARRALVIAAEIATADGPVSFSSIHLDTVRKGIEPMLHEGVGATGELQENVALRDRQSHAAEAWIRKRDTHPAIVAGDFNMPTDSAIYRHNWRGWSDAFESIGTGLGHTKFTSLWGIRIDHVLFDDRWEAVSSRVGPDVGSDHRPLIVTLQRSSAAGRQQRN
jgi:vancomycin resistance protein VanJ